MSELKKYLKKIVDGRDLQSLEAQRCFQIIMKGGATPAQIAAFLTALSMKGETIAEITSAANVIRSKAEKFNAPDNCIDTCGTGGDGHSTFNISTAVAFVVAGAGIPVAKHGNKAVSSMSGSADVLSSLGIRVDCDKTLMEQALIDANICFMMAPKFHKAMRHVAPIRQELGFRSIFNMLGPLLNPASAKYQLLGVYSEKLLLPIANVLKELGVKNAMVVHGSDGLDEITLTGKSYVSELIDSNIISYEVDPKIYGMKYCSLDDLRGGDALVNSQELKALLRGKGNEYYKDIVILNAAAALKIAQKADSIERAMEIAEESIISGAANESLVKLVEITNS